MLSDFPSPDVGSYLMKNHHEIQNSNNDAEQSGHTQLTIQCYYNSLTFSTRAELVNKIKF